jgi:hypothetical protein
VIRLALAAALLSVASDDAPAKSVPDAAGLYRINQIEMAGGLELSPDGRFRYGFDYGAVSEVSEGNWTFEDGKVVLTTNPMPPPAECDRGYATACFDRTPLTHDGENWILYRWDARIVLKPVQPRPR